MSRVSAGGREKAPPRGNGVLFSTASTSMVHGVSFPQLVHRFKGKSPLMVEKAFLCDTGLYSMRTQCWA
jgi:hypothetical protein